VSFAALNLCVASQQVFIFVVVYFVTESIQKLLDTPSYFDMHDVSGLQFTLIFFYCFTEYIVLLRVSNGSLKACDYGRFITPKIILDISNRGLLVCEAV
jgi:hypothetical protein